MSESSPNDRHKMKPDETVSRTQDRCPPSLHFILFPFWIRRSTHFVVFYSGIESKFIKSITHISIK